jgi:ABC-type transporter Mla maintaining outer membrane lipid asymmetry ATPase subunit MlaF
VASGEAGAVLESKDELVRQFVSGDTSGPIRLRDP